MSALPVAVVVPPAPARLHGVPTDPTDPAALADVAVRALREEAELTPKPGLVDRRGCGAHTDMDLPKLLASAEALRPAFEDLALVGARLPVGTALRARVGGTGRAGERRMLRATGGVNTHRGALWALGLLVTGAASAGAAAPGTPAIGPVVTRAAGLARIADPAAPPRATPSHGEIVRRRHGTQGAAGEARAGFPHVTRVALPVLWAARARGADEGHARLDALLAVMAHLEDTCVLHRGRAAGLAVIRRGATQVLAAGGTASAAGASLLARLDAEARARGLSPGGSADLLAAALFLDGLLPDGPCLDRSSSPGRKDP